MEITINVKLSASPELISFLQTICKGVGSPVTGSDNGKLVTMASKNGKAGEEKPAATDTDNQSGTPAATTANATSATVIKIEVIREQVTKKAGEGKREAVKALLAEFGVGGVKELKKEQYAEFYPKIQAL
jgi:hypothetical protein